MFNFEIEKLFRVIHMRMNKYCRDLEVTFGGFCDIVVIKSFRDVKIFDITLFDIDIESNVRVSWDRENPYELKPFLRLNMSNMQTTMNLLWILYLSTDNSVKNDLAMLYSHLFKNNLPDFMKLESAFDRCFNELMDRTNNGPFSVWDVYEWKYDQGGRYDNTFKSDFLSALIECNLELTGEANNAKILRFKDERSAIVRAYNKVMVLKNTRPEKLDKIEDLKKKVSRDIIDYQRNYDSAYAHSFDDD